MAFVDSTIVTQTHVLVWRNLRLKRRTRAALFQEIFYPLLYVGILLGISRIVPMTTYPEIPYFAPVNATNVHDSSIIVASPLTFLYAPSGSLLVDEVATRISALLGAQLNESVTGMGVADADALTAYYVENPMMVWAGLVFNLDDIHAPQFEIRINASFVPSSSQLAGNQGQCRSGPNGIPTPCNVAEYMKSGYLMLQNLVNQALFEVLVLNGNQSGVHVDGTAQQMGLGAYQTSNTTLNILASVYLVFAMSPLFQFLMVNLVVEKEKKMKEIMELAGMRESAFYLSWLITNALFSIVVTLIMAVMLTKGGVFPNSNFFLIFLILFLYALSLISMAFVVSIFFSNSKMAGRRIFLFFFFFSSLLFHEAPFSFVFFFVDF